MHVLGGKKLTAAVIKGAFAVVAVINAPETVIGCADQVGFPYGRCDTDIATGIAIIDGIGAACGGIKDADIAIQQCLVDPVLQVVPAMSFHKDVFAFYIAAITRP